MLISDRTSAARVTDIITGKNVSFETYWNFNSYWVWLITASSGVALAEIPLILKEGARYWYLCKYLFMFCENV